MTDATMVGLSLQQALDEGPDPIRVLRAAAVGGQMDDGGFQGIGGQGASFQDEQYSWQQGVSFFDQSGPLTEFDIRGPGAEAFLARMSPTSFTRFPVGRAKQYLLVNGEGYVISDGIVSRLGEDSFRVNLSPNSDWLVYHAERAPEEFEFVFNPAERRHVPLDYRFELQGPNAHAFLADVTGAAVPDTRFFHIAEFTIAGRRVQGIRHGMAGQPGFELFGPWEDRDAVFEALMEHAEEHGVVRIGGAAYLTQNIESGWFACQLQAVFSGESTADFRRWAPANLAQRFALGGSFDSERVEDYYVTPFELGYGRLVTSEADYVGREALQRLATTPPTRRAVTLKWDAEDVGAVFAGLAPEDGGLPTQPLTPLAYIAFASTQYDSVLVGDEVVGFNAQSAYLAPHRAFLSHAMVDVAHAEPGTEVRVLWGDSLRLPRVGIEPHRQREIRATVVPTPYADFARQGYRG